MKLQFDWDSTFVTIHRGITCMLSLGLTLSFTSYDASASALNTKFTQPGAMLSHVIPL